jgi:glutathione peroxidase-family protein
LGQTACPRPRDSDDGCAVHSVSDDHKQSGSLADYADRVLLVVNVASRCGLTPQHDGLQALYARYQDQRFTVLGFPANDFRSRSQARTRNSRVLPRNVLGDLPLFDKIAVTGTDKHPPYALLIDAAPHAKVIQPRTVSGCAALHRRQRRPRDPLEFREVPHWLGRHGAGAVRTDRHSGRAGTVEGDRIRTR